MATSLRNLAFDGSTGRIRFGAQAVLLTKIQLPKEELKEGKERYIGEQVARARTPGVLDVGMLEIETTSAAFVGIILPAWQVHGNNFPEFPVTVSDRHPLVSGPYSRILDRCRFLNIEEAIENSEKASIVKLGLSVIEVFRRGTDGIWKTLGYEPSLGSAAAQALMF